jgi:peptide/nickel transport system permease protein
MTAMYVLRRIGLFLVIVWTAATLNFLAPRLTGKDPIEQQLLRQTAQGGSVEAGIADISRVYRQKFGLDQPIWVQYRDYVANVGTLDFGYSISNYPETVDAILLEALPWTIGLLLTSTLIAFVIGTLLGAIGGWPKAHAAVQWLMPPLLTFSAVPYYLLALVLLEIFAFQLRLLPIYGGYSAGTIPAMTPQFALNVLGHSFLPALSIVLAGIGSWAVGMRAMMVGVQGEDFMLMAEAKGLKGSTIFFRYAIRNALLPQATSLGLALGQILSGAVLVEVVFGYPGIGTVLYHAIQDFDYTVIQGVVLTVILAISGVTLVLDLVYPLLDPRIVYRRA